VAAPAASTEWLVVYEDDAMRAHMLVFSKGARVAGHGHCAGGAEAGDGAGVRLANKRQTMADMRVTDRFVLSPRSGRCQLVFE
jgi:hypothetical protein